MPGQIKGITIEFDGNTTKLTAALNKVKAEARSVDSSLKQVNQQLKFDPHNTELLGQKQQLLKQKIEATKTELTKFRDIQKQLDAQKVEKTSAEYMKVRREILKAEGQLKAFNAQLARAKWQGMQNLGKGLTDVGHKLTRATRYARLFTAALAGMALYKGFERLKSLDEVSKQMEVLGYRGKKLDGIMEDVSSSVNGTRFMLQDMGKVATGALGSGVTDSYKLADYLKRTADLAQLAGIDVQSMGAMMNKAYSKGKVDAKIMNQLNAHGIPIYKLMQKELGVTAEELQDMSKKGELSFDDLYRATSKYEGLAEKMGTETLPGALTVLSQQFGLIGADFLSGVYEPLKDGVKGIVASIKELRKNGTFKEWGKDLGDTVKYFVEYFKEGSASMDGLSERAQGIVNVLGPLIKTIGALVQAFAQLPSSLQGVLVFMTLFGGPMLTALGNGVSLFAQLGANITTMSLNAQAGVGALSGLSGGLSMLLNPLTLATLAIGAWALGMKKAYDEEHQWTQGFEEFQEASAKKMESVQAENGMVDIYAAKLEELINKEHKSAGEKALIKQYVDKLNGAVEGLNLKYNEEKDKLNKTTEAIHKKIDAYKEAALVKAYEDQITAAAKKQAEAQIQLSNLMDEKTKIQKKWADATDHSAVAEQGYKMALGDVNRKIADAKSAISKYDDEMNKSAKEVEKLSNSTKKGMDKSADSAKKGGEKTAKNYHMSVKKGEDKSKAAGEALGEAAADGASNTSGMESAGESAASGFASGIRAKIASVASAAADMVKKAIAAAKKEEKQGSPAKKFIPVGVSAAQGYAVGIRQGTAQAVTAASRNMVGSAISAATAPTGGLGLTSAGGLGNVYVNMTINGVQDGKTFADEFAAELMVQARG